MENSNYETIRGNYDFASGWLNIAQFLQIAGGAEVSIGSTITFESRSILLV